MQMPAASSGDSSPLAVAPTASLSMAERRMTMDDDPRRRPFELESVATIRGTPLCAADKPEEQRLLGHRLRPRGERRHLVLAERRELARQLYVLFQLRDRIAADNHRADRVRERIIQRLAHGERPRCGGNHRAFPRVLLAL